MSETHEMRTIPADAQLAYKHVWIHNRGHFVAALIFAIVGIAAAVGLGSGDWYVVEASTYQKPGWLPTAVTAPGFPGSLATDFGSTFVTIYFGLRMGYICNGPQASSVPFATNIAPTGFGFEFCSPFTYKSKYIAYNVLESDPNAAPGFDPNLKNNAGAAVTAYYQLMGSSGIITAVLAVAVVVCAALFLANAGSAHGWGDFRLTKFSKIGLVVAIICIALALIFWITIFPYQYFTNNEALLMYGAPYSYDIYHTLGLGFSIQIAGLLVGLAGLIMYPNTSNGGKQGNTV